MHFGMRFNTSEIPSLLIISEERNIRSRQTMVVLLQPITDNGTFCVDTGYLDSNWQALTYTRPSCTSKQDRLDARTNFYTHIIYAVPIVLYIE